ncbi:MAG: hypothetical protein LBR71_01150 [Synergistaceae bacterium]|jgi:hypothetical protein|nr:hypothetical protein [Synergistaceae bacterium]
MPWTLSATASEKALNDLIATLEEVVRQKWQMRNRAADEGKSELSANLEKDIFAVGSWLHTLSGLREEMSRSEIWAAVQEPYAGGTPCENEPAVPETPRPQESSSSEKSVAESPARFSLLGKQYEFTGWKKLYLKVCESMILAKPYVMIELDKNEDLNRLAADDNSPARVIFSGTENKIEGEAHRLSNGLYTELLSEKSEVIETASRILEECTFSRDELSMQYE